MNILVDKYLTTYGYSWVDEAKKKQLEVVAQFVESDLFSIYGSNIDFAETENYRWTSLALTGMQYFLNNAYDDFKKNYESELVSLSVEGRILNAEVEGSV